MSSRFFSRARCSRTSLLMSRSQKKSKRDDSFIFFANGFGAFAFTNFRLDRFSDNIVVFLFLIRYTMTSRLRFSREQLSFTTQSTRVHQWLRFENVTYFCSSVVRALKSVKHAWCTDVRQRLFGIRSDNGKSRTTSFERTVQLSAPVKSKTVTKSTRTHRIPIEPTAVASNVTLKG